MVIKEEHIYNQTLKEALINSRGADLRRLPAISITLLPEMRPLEIRRGLIDLVLQLFEPGSSGKSLVQLVDEGLERLSETISVPAKSKLRDSVKREMDGLAKGPMNGYLFFDETERVYKSTEKFKPHPKTMERIALALKDWAGIGLQKTLDYWTTHSSLYSTIRISSERPYSPVHNRIDQLICPLDQLPERSKLAYRCLEFGSERLNRLRRAGSISSFFLFFLVTPRSPSNRACTSVSWSWG